MSVDDWFYSSNPSKRSPPVEPEKDGKPVLYRCPYCKAGRFTDPVNGFKEAEEHIRKYHRKGSMPERKD